MMLSSFLKRKIKKYSNEPNIRTTIVFNIL